MRVLIHLLIVALASLVAARSAQHVGKVLPEPASKVQRFAAAPEAYRVVEKRASPYLNASTTKFAVNGSAIPDVPFDIGESYAGLLPISQSPNETRQLYFWFFPSENPAAADEITIWLNGGPGCSSLEGLLQENGPFLWQYGTFAPVPNPYTWVNLTNMVWVEQPVGTGFSQGTPNATSETDVAAEFLGFFKNFVETFSLQGRKVFITGESYAGAYVPYIADAMFNANDTDYYNIDSILIYDPSTSSSAVQEQIPAVAFVEYWDNLFSLNATFMANLTSQADACGYTAFLNDYLVFPPNGTLPTPPNVDGDVPGCDLWDAIYYAASEINPCFDVYQIATTCPLLWDVLGFPGSFDYLPAGASVYFNRSDVQKAINAPPTNWMECTNTDVFVNGTDNSPPSGLSVLPGVIEKTNKTIIAHGMLDYVLIMNGTLLMIQNMTWNGAQGFQSAPSDPFFVPYHSELSDSTLAGAGVFGTTHTERGLTFVTVNLSGHMVPQYAPAAAYRQLEFLLGRIDSLTQMSDFTTQTGDFGNS
ncbi:carboxypeptidase d [Lasallia pustulata]|uniref:Carboxypeptidase n=1 Tax=Lasallia pustulata TaxID=136370 RepID=A0A1W5CRX2_9LECA|nr:carboxypeptidase d [Lasallia pustulata]